MSGRAKAVINDGTPEEARAVLFRACGAARWVERMLLRRPFANDARLLSAARIEWFGLTEADWLEAFSHHPRIGDRASLEARFPATHDLSANEQARVGGASAEISAELADANQRYFNRFGFIFIVCATEKSAEDMLESLRARLQNDRSTELRVAAEEQARITALRLR